MASSCLAAVLVGCGGGGNAGGKTIAKTDFGYPETLYRGTLTVTDAGGTSVSGPVGITVSSDQEVVYAAGIDDVIGESGGWVTQFYRLVRDPASGTAVQGASIGDTGTSSVEAMGGHVSATFLGANGVTASLVGTADLPNLKPFKPPAGKYTGSIYGRGSRSGRLAFAGRAYDGYVKADGTFRFVYDANGMTATPDGTWPFGMLDGKIAKDGSITNVKVGRRDSYVELTDLRAMAYGTPDNLTVVVRSGSTDEVGETYRLKRVGDYAFP